MTTRAAAAPAGAVLHNFFRSSTSHRVRIALNLKRVSYAYVPYRLRLGEQRGEDYLALNPQGLVPTLTFADGTRLAQSLAIIEYLDETVPDPPLLPGSPAERARIRSLAQMIAMDIHPINNLRVLDALRTHFDADEAAVADWFRHWVAETFAPLEERLAGEHETGVFCHGDEPTLADICLAAQSASSTRFKVSLEPYPTIGRIVATCQALPAFQAAMPAAQPDAE